LHGGLTDRARGADGTLGAGLDPGPGRGAFQAAMTAVAVLAALALFVSACATGGTGTRDEGPAHVETSAGSERAAGAAPAATASYSGNLTKAEAAQLLKDDPSVSAEVKNDLQPCTGDDPPVDVTSGDLTGGTARDVVVNVLTCGDIIGIGAYVYRLQDGAYENVFKAEEPPVYAQIDRGDLVVDKQVYEKGDAVAAPSGEYVFIYHWTAGRFVKRWDQYSEYGKTSDGPAETTPTPVPTT